MFNAYKFEDNLVEFERITRNNDQIDFYFEGRRVKATLLKRLGSRLWIELFEGSEKITDQPICIEMIQSSKQQKFRVNIKDADFEFKALHNAQESDNTEDTYTAPMTAKVVKVMIQKNQMVEKGQSLIVLEAMKLQIDIKAFDSHKIDQILVSEGDQVQQGDQLLTMAQPHED